MMENDMINRTKEDIKGYTKALAEIGRLRVVRAASKALGLFLVIFTVILLLFAVLAFLSVSAISALSTVMPVWAASLIMAGVCGLVIACVIASRKRLFVHPFIRLMTSLDSEEELMNEQHEAAHKMEVHAARLETRMEDTADHIRLFYKQLIIRLWDKWIDKNKEEKPSDTKENEQ